MLPLLAAAIISTTVSNASTGGLSAQAGNVSSGGDVVNGSSYSSVSVQTYSNEEGGTSTVEVETDNNGEVNQQTYTKTVPPGGSAAIYVATSTGNGSARVQVDSVVGTGASGTSWHGKHATSSPLWASSTALEASSTASSSFSLNTSEPGFGFLAFFNSLFNWNLLRFW